MSEQAQEKSLRIKVSVELGELSSKQRGSVLGLIKDMGFTRGEIEELTIVIPEDDEPGGEGRRQKWK